MRFISSFALGILVICAASTSFAQEEGGQTAGKSAAVSSDSPPDTGGKIKVGLRLGYAIPMGVIQKGTGGASDAKLSDSYQRAVGA